MYINDITGKQAAVLAGMVTGGYLSDADDNFVGGIPAIGIGALVGGSLRLPNSQVLGNNPLNINMGPQVDSTLVGRGFMKYEEDLNNPQNASRVGNLFNKINKAESFVERYDKRIEKSISDRDEEIERDRKRVISQAENVNKQHDKLVDSFTARHEKLSDAEFERISKSMQTISSKSELNLVRARAERVFKNIQKSVERSPELKSALETYTNQQIPRRPHLNKLDKRGLTELMYDEFSKQTDNPKSSRQLKSIISEAEEQGRDRFNRNLSEIKGDNKYWGNLTIDSVEKNNKAFFDKIVSGINNRRNIELDSITSAEDWINRTYNPHIDNLVNNRQETIDGINTRVDGYKSKIEGVKEALKSSGVSFDEDDEKDISRALREIDDKGLHHRVSNILRGDYSKEVNLDKVKAQELKSKYQSIAEGDYEGLTKWFKEELGNNVEDANRKAEMFMKRAEEGSVLVAKNGSITLKDKLNGEEVTMPVTSYAENGNRFHYAGGGNYSTATQFNPYGLAYKEGIQVDIDGTGPRTVTAQDMLKGYDPEEWMRFAGEDTPLSDISKRTERLFHYNSQDAGTSSIHLGSDFDASSASFQNHQGMVDLSQSLNFKDNGSLNSEYPVRKVQTGANLENQSSEMISILGKLADETNNTTLSNNRSMNSLLTVNSKGIAHLGAAAPTERNPTGVGNRDSTIENMNKDTSSLREVLGEKHFNSQFSSSQALKKLDVVDVEAFNSLSADLFGSTNTLFDGAGLYNRSVGEDFNIKDTVTFKLNKNELTTVHNEELVKALSQKDLPLGEYLQQNPITIGNELLATNGDFDVGLKRHYNSAEINNAAMVGGNLILSAEAKFDANMENNVKLFSVGSKLLNTGVQEDTFMLQHALGLGLNSGDIKLDSDGNATLKGKSVTQDELVEHLKEEAKNIDSPVHLISSAGDTGVEDIMKAMNNGMQGNNIYDGLVEKEYSKETSALAAMVFTENKANVDLNASLLLAESDRIKSLNLPEKEEQAQLRKLGNFFKTINSHTAKNSNYQEYAANIIDSTGLANRYSQGLSTTVGSLNKGKSITGTGNRAGMSWVAVQSLLQSGLTKEQLGAFGSANEELLYEVKSHITEQYVNKNSVNKAVAGKEASLLHILSSTIDPSLRLDLIQQHFGEEATRGLYDNHFISYNLHNEADGIKSLNFSRINTNRSGYFKTTEGREMLKDLDKRRTNLMQADLGLKYAQEGSAKNRAQEEFNRAVKSYQESIKVVYSGDNNLAKKALALVSPTSSIMQVKAVGGEAAEYADRAREGTLLQKFDKNANKLPSTQVWFASEEELLRRAKQANLEIEFRQAKGFKDIKQAFTKLENGEWIPFTSLITREPAQGPMSSDLVHWATTSTIKNTVVDENGKGDTLHNAYTTNNNTMYSLGASGDGDQDTLQTLTSKFKTKEEYEAFEKQRQYVRGTFLEMEPLLKLMGAKSNKTKKILSIDSMTQDEHAAYNMAGAIKGRNRKTLAAKATEIATHFNKELSMAMDTSNPQEAKELLKARMAVYQIVENLLKSSHIDTANFLSIAQQPVERMVALRNQYIGKSGNAITRDQYEKGLRKILPEFLNLGAINKQGNAEQIAEAARLQENIVKASGANALNLKDVNYSPLDLPENRLNASHSDFLSAVGEITGHSSIVDPEFANYDADIGKAAKQTYNSAKTAVMDVLRNNKLKIGAGLAGMGAVALMTRSQPDFEKPHREYSANMMRAPSSHHLSDYIPMGMETNPNKTAHMMPKSFQGKNVNARYSNNEEDSPFTDFMESPEQTTSNMMSSMFGNGIRTARLIN